MFEKCTLSVNPTFRGCPRNAIDALKMYTFDMISNLHMVIQVLTKGNLTKTGSFILMLTGDFVCLPNLIIPCYSTCFRFCLDISYIF